MRVLTRREAVRILMSRRKRGRYKYLRYKQRRKRRGKHDSIATHRYYDAVLKVYYAPAIAKQFHQPPKLQSLTEKAKQKV